MPYLDDQPDSVAHRLIQALADDERPPQAVLEEYHQLREWDPGQLERLTQAFDAAHAVQRLPDSVHATVHQALQRWSRAARNRSTDQMRALPDPADWTEELPLSDAEHRTLAGNAETTTTSRLAARIGAAVEPAVTDDPPSPEPRIRPGTVLLGRYEIFTQLGSGGTALIHGARDRRRDVADGDLQHVAIKTPRTDVADPERAVARLKREFRQTRLLPHPNIVRMFDLDCDRGLWFITMEWLDGESLARRLRRAAPDPLPVHEIWPIVTTCGQALAFAHGRGIVHGDFKPSNIMIGVNGEAHLLDFGAAPDVSSSGESDPDDDGRVLATRCYASPEALAGEAPDPRDDVFSFACVVFEMLAGHHPFDRRAATAARDAGAMPAPIPALDAARFEALARGLAWRREDRPDGVPQLLDGLLGNHRAVQMKPTLPPAIATTVAAGTVAVTRVPVGTAGTATAAAVPAVPTEESSNASAAQSAAATSPAPAARPARAAAASAQATARPRASGRAVYLAFGMLLLLTVGLVFRGLQRSDPPQSSGDSTRGDAVVAGAALQPGAAAPPGALAVPLGAPTDAPVTGLSAAAGSGPAPLPGAIDVPARTPSGQTTIDAPRSAAAVRRPTRYVSLDAVSLQVSEGAFAAVITIHRTGDLRGIVPVSWRLEGGTALPGHDFSGPLQGTARFTSGQRMRTVYIPLINDGEPEEPETFTVSLRPATRVAAPGRVIRTVVTINDDD